ncbi:DUF397 domain-containing protein [Streptomyces sp. NPDC086023]|uniref:DUF397 domain-containing protein n=1 Tax=Streptomyces sp. NPDC086023 TaxID=3365746 RepID=UPI0037D021B4
MTREITSEFRKSSYSDQQGDCLEAAHTADAGRAVRDSKDPASATLLFGATAWSVFVDDLKADRPR